MTYSLCCATCKAPALSRRLPWPSPFSSPSSLGPASGAAEPSSPCTPQICPCQRSLKIPSSTSVRVTQVLAYSDFSLHEIRSEQKDKTLQLGIDQLTCPPCTSGAPWECAPIHPPATRPESQQAAPHPNFICKETQPPRP